MKLWIIATTIVLCLVGAPAQQVNSPQSTMTFEGIGGPPYPVPALTLLTGNQATLRISGGPNLPFALASATHIATPGTVTVAGLLDLHLGSLAIVLDGFEPGSPFSTDAAGAYTSTFVVPSLAPFAVYGGYQALVIDPTSTIGARMSAAVTLGIAPTLDSQTLVLPDDGSVTVDIPPGLGAFTFYQSSHTRFYVNSNGSLSFDFPASDFTATPSEFLAQMPRIAPFWTDLIPDVGGFVVLRRGNAGGSPFFRVDFSGVPSFAGLSIHNFAVELHVGSGEIALYNTPTNSNVSMPVLVGISPGYQPFPPPTQTDLSAATVLIGSPLRPIFEYFGDSSMPYYEASVANAFDLHTTSLRFSPVSGGTNQAAYVLTH